MQGDLERETVLLYCLAGIGSVGLNPCPEELARRLSDLRVALYPHWGLWGRARLGTTYLLAGIVIETETPFLVNPASPE